MIFENQMSGMVEELAQSQLRDKLDADVFQCCVRIRGFRNYRIS